MTTDRPLVEVDARKRLSLGRHVPPDKRFKFYFIEVGDDGRIVLTPATVSDAL